MSKHNGNYGNKVRNRDHITVALDFTPQLFIKANLTACYHLYWSNEAQVPVPATDCLRIKYYLVKCYQFILSKSAMV